MEVVNKNTYNIKPQNPKCFKTSSKIVNSPSTQRQIGLSRPSPSCKPPPPSPSSSNDLNIRTNGEATCHMQTLVTLESVAEVSRNSWCASMG